MLLQEIVLDLPEGLLHCTPRAYSYLTPDLWKEESLDKSLIHTSDTTVSSRAISLATLLCGLRFVALLNVSGLLSVRHLDELL